MAEENEPVVKLEDQVPLEGLIVPKTINFNPITHQHVEEKVVEKKAEEAKPLVEPPKEEPVLKVEEPVKEASKVEEPLKEDPKKEETVFEIASPFDAIKKADEISVSKYGVPYHEAMAFKNTNHEEMDDLDVVETAYKLEDPDITDKELQAKNIKFQPLFMEKEELDKMIEDGKITEQDIVLLDAEFEGLKRKSLQTINKFKSTITFDEIKFSQKSEKTETPKVEESQINAMKDAVTKILTDFKQDKFTVKDKEGKELATINVETPKAEDVIGIAADPNSIYKLWMDEKGNLDVAKYTRDISRLQNIDKIVEVAYSLGVNKGREIEGKEGANITLDKKGENLHKETPKVTPHNMVLKNLT